MEHPGLRGRSILVVENEFLIAMDITKALEDAGAHATMTTTARHALILIEHDGLAGAIMDHGLSDGDSSKVCARLKGRGIPYISYSGYDPVPGADPDASAHNQACEHGRVDERHGRVARRAGASVLMQSVHQMLSAGKPELTTMERAFQLAEASTCTTISDIKNRLRAEGYEGDQIDGRTLKRQLRALMKARHA